MRAWQDACCSCWADGGTVMFGDAMTLALCCFPGRGSSKARAILHSQ